MTLVVGVTLGVLGAAGEASAWEYDRYVVVNGQPMSASDLAVLDYVAGEPVPNGRYWLDYATGEWGYEGGPVQGVIGEDSGNHGGSAQGPFSYDRTKEDFCVSNPGICP
jgi:hypothetical protein